MPNSNFAKKLANTERNSNFCVHFSPKKTCFCSITLTILARATTNSVPFLSPVMSILTLTHSVQNCFCSNSLFHQKRHMQPEVLRPSYAARGTRTKRQFNFLNTLRHIGFCSLRRNSCPMDFWPWRWELAVLSLDRHMRLEVFSASYWLWVAPGVICT